MAARTWTPLAVGFLRHPKLAGATAPVKLLAISAMLYAQDNLTDGHIPTGALAGIALEAACPPKKAAELEQRGLWDPVPGGWQIHGWHEWNRPAELVEELRAKKGEAGALGNHRRWHLARGIVDPNCEHCRTCDPPAIPPRSHTRIANGSPPTPTPSDNPPQTQGDGHPQTVDNLAAVRALRTDLG